MPEVVRREILRRVNERRFTLPLMDASLGCSPLESSGMNF